MSECANPDEAYELYLKLHEVLAGKDGNIGVHALVECLADAYDGSPKVTKSQFVDYVSAQLRRACELHDELHGRTSKDSLIILANSRLVY